MSECSGVPADFYETQPGYSWNCDQVITDYKEKRLDFNQDQAERCLTQIQALTCEGINLWSDKLELPECKNIWIGLVSAEGVCANDDVCVSGYYCLPPREVPTLNPLCPGRCVSGTTLISPPGKGELCTWLVPTPCQEGLGCMDVDGDSNYTCQMYKTGTEKCIAHWQCANEFFCDIGVTDNCIPVTGIGSPCFEVSSCTSGLVCDNGETCQLPVKVGDTCDSYTSCVWGECGSDLKCPGPQLIGDACGEDLGNCGQGYCSTDTSTTSGSCKALKLAGTSCTDAEECANQYCENSICVTQCE